MFKSIHRLLLSRKKNGFAKSGFKADGISWNYSESAEGFSANHVTCLVLWGGMSVRRSERGKAGFSGGYKVNDVPSVLKLTDVLCSSLTLTTRDARLSLGVCLSSSLHHGVCRETCCVTVSCCADTHRTTFPHFGTIRLNTSEFWSWYPSPGSNKWWPWCCTLKIQNSQSQWVTVLPLYRLLYFSLDSKKREPYAPLPLYSHGNLSC